MSFLLVNLVISLWVTCLTALFLAIFVLLKGRWKTNFYRYFSFYCISVAWWSFCEIWWVTATDKSIALLWCRVAEIGVFFIPTFFIHFAISFLNIKGRKSFLFIAYAISLFLAIISNTELLIKDMIPKFFVNYWVKPGILYPFAVIFFAICICYGSYELFKAYINSTGSRRNQMKYLFWPCLIAYLGGGANFLLSFNINIPVLNPFGTYFVPLYVLILVYAIVRFRLIEIEVAIRKTIVFAGVFGFVFAIFAGAAYLAESYWASIIGSRFLTMGIAVLLIVLIQEPLKDMLVKYTNRFLLQKKYDYQKVLRDASEGMAMVRESKWLLGLITHIISSKMRVSNIGIFIEEDLLATDHYFLKAKRGKEPINLDSLSKDNPICLWLKENKKPLVLEEIDYLLQRKGYTANHSSQKNILTRIKSQMQSLNSKVIIPAYYKGGLLGFLSLGYKLSGDTYTKEDLILLSTLSSSAAVAIENARLFDSLIDEIEINNHLRKEEEDSYMQMMMSLAKTIDAKDSYTYDHVEMVYQYGVDLGQYLAGVNNDALKASLRLHDLGKIGVPDSILSKQGPLDPEEWKKIKEHTVLGARILSPLKKFEYVAKIILYHQEKFDGTGYPAGLKGDQIPLESRIISVVDAYHAMVSDRPYRKALPKATAVAELKKFKGTQFDPIVVDAFLKLLKEKHGVTEAG